MKVNVSAKIVCAVLAILSLSGCLSRSAVVKNTFLLETLRNGTKRESGSQEILSVQPFSIAPAFQRSNIVSRIGENEYEADYYNEYFVLPAVMVTNQTRQWLTESSLFKQVLSPGSTVLPTYILDGHVAVIVLDESDAEHPQAILSISFYLVKKQKRDETITFHKTYTVTRSMQNSSVRAYAAAQTLALTEILQSAEKDLAEVLNKEE